MIKMNEPKVLTRMRLSCCWGDNLNEEELNEVVDYISYLQNNWNELNKFIEEEKNRLATQVSNTYKDSLDKIHFVNEDIFNELTKVSGKMQEIGWDNE